MSLSVAGLWDTLQDSLAFAVGVIIVISTSSSPNKLDLPTGLPIGTVNAYYFDDPIPTLVDTGLKSPEALKVLKQSLHTLGRNISDLQRIIISHEHVDHFGLANILTQRCEAEVIVFEPTIPTLVDYSQSWSQRISFYQDTIFPKLGLSEAVVQPLLEYYQNVRLLADEIPENRIQAVGAGETLELGDQLWTVLHVPGHCSQLTCFFQPETKQLLSTDMLLQQTPTPIIDPSDSPSDLYTPALPEFLHSLDKISVLDVDTVYPGHGDIFSSHRELILKQKARIERRKQACLQLVQAGNSTVEPILLAMYPHYPPQYRFAALWMLVGYLDLLQATGDITRTDRDGVWRYHPA